VSTPILEKNQIVGAVVIFKDITERQIVERMKNEFVSVVSHELRTPLTSIRSALGLLSKGSLNNKPQKSQRMLEIAFDNTNRLVRLINDILDIERINSGKVTMEKQHCNASKLMMQAVDEMRAMAERAEVKLALKPIEVQLWADPDRIVQTLTNLLSNAIKFSPPDSTVSLNAKLENSQVLFQVKDRGRGIPEDKLETIFDRFQQVDASNSRNQGGTGLGLAICRSIVQQHGGNIWVKSTLEKGSTFYFTLPISN
ncbi:MAG: ATP-binding protein, partial [Cyanobacteria bacterium P01_H01_bin.150]